MRNLSRNETIGLMTLLALITGLVGFSALRKTGATPSSGIVLRDASPQTPVVSPIRSPASDNSSTTISAPVTETPAPAPPAEIVVHVAGAVKKPGVYHLSPNARNDDALKAAGGATSEANTDAVNLAAKIEDASQLYIPTRKEQPEGGAQSPVTTKSAVTAPTKTGAHEAVKKGGSPGGKSAKLSDPSQGTVNINTANEEDLQKLPGIGPAMAARILEYRQQNGRFQTPEDLLQISGIGEKKFAKMQPFVRVK